MSHRTKLAKEKAKQEVSEKVKEIKQRQQNWFRQRDSALKQSTDSSDSQTNGKPRNVGSYGGKQTSRADSTLSKVAVNRNTGYVPLRSNSKDRIHETGQHGAKNNRFQTWRKARSDTSAVDQEDSNEVRSDVAKGRPRTYNVTNCRTAPTVSDEEDGSHSDYSDTSSSCTELKYIGQSQPGSSRSGSQPLTPEMFDTLADQIAERVKKELRSNDYADSRPRDTVQSGHVSIRQGGAQEKGLESHYCTECANLMVPPVHTPMLVIPCGHSLCQSCGQGRMTCPQCSSQVSSLTCNIMLQQIILDFKQKRQTQKKAPTNTYQAEKYSESKRADYQEKYQTLLLRYQVLESESKTIKENLSIIDGEMGKGKNTLGNISREEEKVEDEIQKLEQKLTILRQHKAEYKEKVEEFENQHFEEANRLALLEESMKSLKNEMEKVKMLSNHGEYDY